MSVWNKIRYCTLGGSAKLATGHRAMSYRRWGFEAKVPQQHGTNGPTTIVPVVITKPTVPNQFTLNFRSVIVRVLPRRREGTVMNCQIKALPQKAYAKLILKSFRHATTGRNDSPKAESCNCMSSKSPKYLQVTAYAWGMVLLLQSFDLLSISSHMLAQNTSGSSYLLTDKRAASSWIPVKGNDTTFTSCLSKQFSDHVLLLAFRRSLKST